MKCTFFFAMFCEYGELVGKFLAVSAWINMIIDRKRSNVGVVGLCLMGLSIGGCTSDRTIKLDSDDHLAQINYDQRNLYPALEPASGGVLDMSLSDAIDRSLRHNLDARVAAMETLIAQDNVTLAKMEAIPNLTTSGTFTRRNNVASSSSQSILTGTQSLEPSTSSDTTRQLADIKAQWNIMDAVIAYLDGYNAEDSAIIAGERLRKVQQNIERDVINAYWQAYAGQKSEKTIGVLSTDVAKLEVSIKQALGEKMIPITDGGARITSLLQNQRQLNELFQVAQLSKSELKAISALPVDANINLSTRPDDLDGKLKKLIQNKYKDGFVNVALQKRPEVREAYMSSNISIRNVERELKSTVPGLNLIYGHNYDDNSFLTENAWTDFTATITQSLTDLLTLPKRYKAAKNREALEGERRKALTAAIIAQVYIAQIRMGLAETNYNLAKSDYEISKKETHAIIARKNMGAASGYEQTIAKTSVMTKEIQYHQAFAEMQKSYVDMIGTLGLSVSDMIVEKEGDVL